jgi:hypothetical protein
VNKLFNRIRGYYAGAFQAFTFRSVAQSSIATSRLKIIIMFFHNAGFFCFTMQKYPAIQGRKNKFSGHLMKVKLVTE